LSAADTLSAATSPASGVCGPATQTAAPLDNEQGRCGYGPRLPLIVISPYAKQNYVSHDLTDQSSILAFIEQNWSLGQIPGSFANIAGSLDDLFNFSAAPSALAKPLQLDPQTGEPSYPVVGAISPKSAAPASSVTISGMNFSTTLGQTSVYFGNEAAKDVSCQASTTLAAPATTCVVLVPPGSAGQSVPITVKVNGTSGVDDAGNFTYS
jgi:phospholipase C